MFTLRQVTSIGGQQNSVGRPGDQAITIDEAIQRAGIEAREANYDKALYWYRIAEAKGSTHAEVAIGLLYYNGAGGLPVDYAEALRRFEDGANKGDTWAMNNAAIFYWKGIGVAPDPKKVQMLVNKKNARQQEFYPICSDKAVMAAMDDLLQRSRNRPGSILGEMISDLIAQNMQISTENPDIHIVGVRVTDVWTDSDFRCDGIWGRQTKDLCYANNERRC